ncbi:MAG: ABC transporter permease [Actinobacteria bacterium]|nr:ABC transporter permease [Actinomycetota bacterium]MDA3017404.1 ABC transporter permease [Actinomycetota bacterium]
MTSAATLVNDVSVQRSSSASLRQTVALGKRSTIELFRQPALVVPSIVFPLFFSFLGNSSFGKTTSLPGFPKVNSYLQFQLAGTITQGVLFGSITGAAALATDIENGFFDRLLASPTSRLSILFGRLAGSVIFGALETAIFVLALLPFGADVSAGLPGIIAMIISGALIALAVAALMSSVALKTGSSEAVQGTFPLLFILLFFSSAFFPRETMSGVYKTVAGFNPISHLVEGLRALSLEGFSVSATARAILVPMAIAIVALYIASRQLHARLRAN